MKQVNAECMYCGQIVMLEVGEDVTEQELGELAALKCQCEASEQFRGMSESMDKAIENTDELLGEFPETVDIMKKAIRQIATGKIESITVNTGRNVKARTMRTPNGKIKIERYDSTKKVAES